MSRVEASGQPKDPRRIPLESKETPTYHRIVDWKIGPRVREWMADSDEVMLVVGNMPDTIKSGKNRYLDTAENWQAQKSKIHSKIEQWVGDRKDGELTIALCSGARGVDLDAYDAIRKLRVDKPHLKFNVISILPLEQEEFRKESVLGSIQEEHYNNLFNRLLEDPDAVVHEPFFRPITPSEYLHRRRLRDEKVTGERAQERSELLNGNQVSYQVFSDTQRELIRLTRKAYMQNRQFKKSLHVLLVTDGGNAYGGGGTNELVARVYDVFGEVIEKKRGMRRANRVAGDIETAADLEVIAIIQEGLTCDDDGRPIKGRKLSSPLEETDFGDNSEGYENATYLGKVIADHEEQFDFEKRFDTVGTRLKTLFRRDRIRGRAARRSLQQTTESQ